MTYASLFAKKLETLRRGWFPTKHASSTYHFKPFWAQLCYFLFVSVVGFLALKFSKPRTGYEPDDVDLFFTAVSAVTVSSMSTVEMEVFSNSQLIVITILMFLGGEIFISFLGILIQSLKFSSPQLKDTRQNFDFPRQPNITSEEEAIEVGKTTLPTLGLDEDKPPPPPPPPPPTPNSIKTLRNVVFYYLLAIHIVGPSLISAYMIVNPSANNVLKSKGLVLSTFSIFTTVSTFTNCGFLPTNENMMVFRNNSGLLLILIPLILLGNTLYPPCLRFVIYALHRITNKNEYQHIVENHQDLGYDHLMSSKRGWYLLGTVVVFLMAQFVGFIAMEWNSGVMDEMNNLQKLVGSLFQCVNSRHTGESIIDLSSVSSAILVLFVVMMYLPPYTSFLPIGYRQEEAAENKKEKKKIIDNIIFSPISYLAIFVFVVCITERKSIKEDPLNFNLLNVVVEVVSAYGNVGFSTGYSCARRLKLNGNCKDRWVGFVGRWSTAGKFVLILVMFFGRLKKFSIYGGKAWTLI